MKSNKEGFMQIVGVIALAAAGLFAIGVFGTGFKLVTLPWLKFATKVDTNQQIIKKTYNADNVIYNYEWFKSKYEAIGATESKIKNAKGMVTAFEISAGPRTNWTFEDKTEHARLSSVVLGIQNHYEDLVADYNARAKMENRNVFQNDLPLFINLQ